MKVLFFNALYHLGHKYIDQKFIHNLSCISDLTVLAPEKWYDEKLENVVYDYSGEEEPSDSKRYNSWICTLKNCKRAAKIAESCGIHVVIFGEYELSTILVALGYFEKNIKIILCNHNNIDQLSKSKIKRFVFWKIQNRVYHCVLEPFIKEWIVNKYNLSESRIFVWYHPIERKNNIKSFETVYDCVGISNSNDEEIIDEIYKNELESEIIKRNQKHIVLRTKNGNIFDNGFLKIINGWVSQADYDNYCNHAKSILVPFPSSYQYRVSASVLNGIASRKTVLAADIPLVRYYSKKYPTLCIIYEKENILDAILEMNNIAINEEIYRKFLFDHSDLNIRSAMYRDLNYIV